MARISSWSISAGGSLRDLLDRGVRLSHSQAAHLGTEVAQGLAYAHARGLVHRDIKPANLLFDEEGRVRVADFGVARALAEAAYTEPAGAMVGTARYISPESAEGKPVDGRADVYSLGPGALRGAVGHRALRDRHDAWARSWPASAAPLPPHEALGPLDDVLARAAAPEASARLDAAGFAARLGALASALPTPEPLALHPPDHVAPAPLNGFRAPAVSELTQVVPRPRPSRPRSGTKAGPGEIFDAEPGRQRARRVGAGDRRARRRRPAARAGASWPGSSASSVLVLALAAGALVAVHDKVFTPSHPVPTLTGLTLAQARAAAAKDHFTLQVEKGVNVHHRRQPA